MPHDGKVDGSDYSLIDDNAYNQQGAGLAARIAAKPSVRLAAVSADSPAVSAGSWTVRHETVASEIFSDDQSAFVDTIVACSAQVSTHA